MKQALHTLCVETRGKGLVEIGPNTLEVFRVWTDEVRELEPVR